MNAVRLLGVAAILAALEPDLAIYSVILTVSILGYVAIHGQAGYRKQATVLAVAVIAVLVTVLGIRSDLAVLMTYVFMATAPNAIALVLPLAAIQLPPLTSVMAILSEQCPLGLAPAIPSLLLVVLLVASKPTTYLRGACALAASAAASFIAYYFGADPAYQSLACTLAVGWFMWLWIDGTAGWRLAHAALCGTALAGVLLIANGMSWKAELVYWIPEPLDVTGEAFFENYAEVLSVSGIKGTVVRSASTIPPNSTVVIPYAFGGQLDNFLRAAAELPHYRSLRFVIFGEHTNAGDLAIATSRQVKGIGFNVDTTVPYMNRDSFGALASASLLSISSQLPLNRGASIFVRDLRVIPLLTSFSAYTEHDYSSDGRLGDYRFRAGKRSGPVVLAAVYAGSPSWVLIGDNSPALSELVVQQPQSFTRLLELGTLRPALASALFLFGLVLMALLGKARHSFRRNVTISVGIMALFGLALALDRSTKEHFYSEEGASVKRVDLPIYGERADGKALVALAPSLIQAKGRIEFGGSDSDSIIKHPNRQTIIVGNLNSVKQVLGVRLEECGRVGGINVNSVIIMDGTTCNISGASPVIGEQNDAVAYRPTLYPHTLIVMDKHFLANAAPPANARWIKEQLTSTNH